MQLVGTVDQIWRFPVKSMQGDTVAQAAVSARGILGDRAWAMRDEARAEIQWGKMFPDLMLCRARYLEEPVGDSTSPVEITFPDGAVLTSNDAAVHTKLSELVGREATLRAREPAENKDFYKRYKPDPEKFQQEMVGAFAREPGEPVPDMTQFPEVLMDYVAVPGTFFDNEEIHLISDASITHMRSLNPDADWDIRRFRPNFYLKLEPGHSGLAEQSWIGKTLKIGDVVLEISAPTPRCGMTVRPQADLAYDKTILRTIVKEADQNLGVGAHCRQAGTVKVGDQVLLSD